MGKNAVAPSGLHRNFSLKTLMVVIAAWGVLLAWLRWWVAYALVVTAHSEVAWSLCFMASFAFGRTFGPAVHGCAARAAVSGLFAAALLATFCAAWAHHRAMYQFVFGLHEPFPYPDPAINAMLRWFDARNPVHPGSLKLHGEYMTVGFVLGLIVLLGWSVCGLLIGAGTKGRFRRRWMQRMI